MLTIIFPKTSDVVQRVISALFTCPHPVVPFVVWAPVAAWLFYFAAAEITATHAVLWVLTGLVAWTLLEYILHRGLFHWQPQNVTLRRWISNLHLQHHGNPNDSGKMFVGPLSALLVLLPLYSIFSLVIPESPRPLFLGGLLIGYLAYEYLHYAMHRVTLPTVWGRSRQREHLAHHSDSPDANFGVTSGVWDVLLRTRSPSARNT